ncbi:citrate/2-methylcitrate synthase [Jiangella asiatica]|uniref:citrate synthase (unknown stereospecificity) n=1 Tax=Jiangella asiatica TaxID=2530372 RepID=A0A4R5CVD8_9ACTN|nr:citrate/2-methylcitrate synthase [Jiangella asiatica]TDE02454.1 helix-turn-helix domain-containing protein [Jiangella asiatica]
MAEPRRLTTRQVAIRLGVKPATVYAYVSRGLLTSRRGLGGRASTFDADEVERLAQRGRGGRPIDDGAPVGGVVGDRAGAPASADGGTHHGDDGAGAALRPAAAAIGPTYSSVTLIEADRHYHRGVDALALAAGYRYEEIAWWLWTGTMTRGIRFEAPADAVAAARRTGDALPAQCGLIDRLRVATIAAAATDPVRFDLAPHTVAGTARGLAATLVDALPARGDAPGPESDLAARLWPRLTARPVTAASVRLLDAAMVLLADHGLAASTVTARVAASARADPYAVVSAGLGTLEGPLHGAASGLAHRMLIDVRERGAGPVVAEHLRAGRRLPGLGHSLYRGDDPRARLLLDLLAELDGAGPAIDAARSVAETAARHLPLHPNIDLALASLSVATRMPPEAGETIFAVARTAGWIAHALDQISAWAVEHLDLPPD